MSRTFRAVPLLAVTGLVLTGCAGTAASPGSASASPEADTAASVHIQVGLEPTSMDVSTTSGAALEMLLIPNVYEGLVDSDGEGGFEPALASEWSMSDDGMVYDFTIRDGVTFHSGEPMTVDDVVWSLERVIADDSTNPDAGLLAGVESVAARGEDGVTIELARPDSEFLEALTSNAGVVLEEGSSVDLANQTNGTGPYTLSQWNKGATASLARFDEYWGEPARNAEAVFHFMSDATTAATALQAGEIDILSTSTAETTPIFEGDENFTVTEGDSRSWMTLGINHAAPPLDDVRVRQALRQAIDKDGLIQVLGGQAIRVGSMAGPADPWYEDLTDIDAYDPEGARALLAEADAQDLELTLRVSNTYDSRISEYIAAQLTEVGVTVNIEQLEFSTWLEDVFQGKNYELSMVLHVAPALAKNYSNPNYYWNYDDATAQQLAADAKVATSADERNGLLAELARHISEQAASDWLYSPVTKVIARAGVSGFPVDGLANRMPVSGIEIAEQ